MIRLLRKTLASKSRDTAGIFLKIALVIMLLSVSSISAKTLKAYQQDIGLVKSWVSVILKLEGDEGQKRAIETKLLADMTKFLPEQDTVEHDGRAINIDNKWLALKLKEYKESSGKLAKKRNILNEIKERLEAIELKLDELQDEAVIGKKKDSNKQKISEILSREEYGKPNDQKSVVGEFIDRILKWFGSLFPKPKIANNKANDWGSVLYGFQILLYILVIGVIGFVVYKFAPLFIERFKRRKSESSSERIILGEKFAADETSENLFKEAERLAREGDLKAAIRKGYISLLFELRERKIIGLAKHKTNRDYLRDVRKRKTLFQNVHGLTLNYERHWYGFETADQKDWEEFKTDYEKALSQS